ncbi:GL25572 [Drosophila persimilis]|uniref:Protein lifeguard 1 n=2 Tax=pseudoobscura subgroup TaxID=32358 RepID=Q29JU6_DROPS|nr:uncharacterized protein LOC4816116 [Drosophila pseudoobscura]XP_002019161.1 uncharacterized protein LOC6593498 [Drosophila persimilis]EDW37357.1 GL25572 [Drosophila persimilis]
MANIYNQNEYRYQIGRPERPQEENVVIIIDPAIMTVFRRHVYFFAAVFCVLSMIPWIIVSATEYDVGEKCPVHPIVWILIAFTCQTILSCCPQTRYSFPCNWILVLSVVIFLTLFGCYFIYSVIIEALLLSVLIAAVLLVILHLCGAHCPSSVLPNAVCTGCIYLLCFLTLIILAILMLVLGDRIYGLIFATVLFFLVVLMIPFSSQYINGRLQYSPLPDTLGCSLGIFIYFIIMVLCLASFRYYYLYYK